MADPVTIFTAFKVVAGVASTVATVSANMDQAARAESEARLADTQALQRDTIARDELTRYLSTVRAARGANGLSADSPNAWVLRKEADDTSTDERLRLRADDRQRAANFRASAKSYKKAGKFSLVTGLATGAGVPIAEYGAYKGWY